MRRPWLIPVLVALTAVACGPPRQVAIAIELMQSEEPAQRAFGARELRELADKGTSGIEAAVPALLTVIYQDDHQRRQADSGEVWSAHGEAFKVLTKVPIEVLLRTLESQGFAEQFSTVTVLAKRKDPRAVEPLIKAHQAADHDGFKRHIVDALGEIGDPSALPTLVDLAKKDDYTAITALGEFKDPRAVDALVRVLVESKSPSNVWYAAKGLQKLGGEAKAIDPLLALMRGVGFERFPAEDRDRYAYRSYMADCLNAPAYKTARVVEALIAVLADKKSNDDLRRSAGSTLLGLTGHTWEKPGERTGKDLDYSQDPKKWDAYWAVHKAKFP